MSSTDRAWRAALEAAEQGPAPQPHYSDDLVTLWHGDCLDVLRMLPDSSVHAVVTDPPYGLEFMGREWDAPWKGGNVGAVVKDPAAERGGFQDGNGGNAYSRSRVEYGRGNKGESAEFGRWCERWLTECLRVMKPGGHLLAFGGTRTWHRLACAVEDVGFEVRDNLAWLYGQGFPKSMNLLDEAGARTGWGTALKPAFEPVVVARKPLAGTVASNVLAHGTGALNIDGCRVAGLADRPGTTPPSTGERNSMSGDLPRQDYEPNDKGRWPANVLLDDSQADELDRQSGVLTSGVGAVKRASAKGGAASVSIGAESRPEGTEMVCYGDSGGASRFFPTFRYEAKAPTVERPRDGEVAHPTVKPLDLMRWLVRLVTPPGGTVLEPFAGSGTTAEACVIEGFRCIAVEREATYLPLIVNRLSKPIQPDLFGGAA